MSSHQTFVAGLCLALVAGACADASSAVDQSLLTSNYTVQLQGGPNGPNGQSFSAGVSGLLTEVDLYTGGDIPNGSNNVNWEIRAGGSSSSTFPPVTFDFGNAQVATLAFHASSLNINVTAGSSYTFLITSVSGSGGLAAQGLLAQAGTNQYAGGRAYEVASFGDTPNDDLAFQTHVVREPASAALLSAGLIGLLGLRRRPTGHRPVSGAWGVLRAASVIVLLPSLAPRSASADVTAVNGSAFGYSMTGANIFGAPQTPIGPTPTVTLPPGGTGGLPNTSSAVTGNAAYGFISFFSSGPIAVSTKGSTGPAGSVLSSTDISAVNTSGLEPFTATSVASTSSASEGGRTGTTTITNGTLQIDDGDDDSSNDIPNHPPVVVAVPLNPGPNTSITGHFQLGNQIENFEYIFNEQIIKPDGSLTVNAVHARFFGPSVLGDLFIGQSVAGVTPIPEPAALSILALAGAGPLLRRRRRRC